MRVRWTRYRFERPGRWSDDTFLFARLYPREFLGARWREIKAEAPLNAGRIVLSIAILAAGRQALADGALNDLSPILVYPLVLGSVALLASCSLSALSYLGYVVEAGLYWNNFVSLARRFDNADAFRRALSEQGASTPGSESIPEPQVLPKPELANAKKPIRLRWPKPMVAILMIGSAALIGRALVSVSGARIPAATRTMHDPHAQIPAALRGVLGDGSPDDRDTAALAVANAAATPDTAGASVRRGTASAGSPTFTLDDLLGPEGGDPKHPRVNETARQSAPLADRAASTTRHHAPEPVSLVAGGNSEVSVGEALRRGIDQTFSETIDLLSDYRLSQTIRLRARDCGKSRSVSYDPSTHVVMLCHQFVVHTYAEALRFGSDEPMDFARDVARFAVAHEIGHALIDVYRLPVLGREEDAADQFAAFLFLENRRPIPLLAAAQSFSESDASLDHEAFADEHALDQQRAANLTCWLVGHAPNENQIIADNLPISRRVRCASEFSTLRASWTALLRPYLRK